MEQKASETDSRKNAAADIVKKGSVITIITLISRPIGFVREAVQAYIFGVTRPVDAFVVAFNFPELIQNLFFSGATSAFLIPVCTKYLDDDNEYSKLYSTFINIAIVLTIPLVSLFLHLQRSHNTFYHRPGVSCTRRAGDDPHTLSHHDTRYRISYGPFRHEGISQRKGTLCRA